MEKITPNLSPYEIRTRAREVVLSLGVPKPFAGYVFKDKDTALVIEYNPIHTPISFIEHIIIYSKPGLFKKIKLFDYINEVGHGKEVRLHVHGEWEKYLEKFYTIAKQKNN